MGNLVNGNGSGYRQFNSWDEGLQALLNQFINGWIFNKKMPPYAGAVNLVNCFASQDNNYYQNQKISFDVLNSYSYNSNTVPTLRQYFNQYAPASTTTSSSNNNPPQYIANVYKTLQLNGINIKSIDQPITDYLS